jgi:hypothetical protein
MIVVAPATPVNSPLTVALAANAQPDLPAPPAMRARNKPLAQNAPAVPLVPRIGAVSLIVPSDLSGLAPRCGLAPRSNLAPRGGLAPRSGLALHDRGRAGPPIDLVARDRRQPSPRTLPPPALANVCRKSWPPPDWAVVVSARN